jgi:hypothetical protein
VDTGIWLKKNLRERDHLVELAIDRYIMLKWGFKERDWSINRICLLQERNSWETCKCGNEPSGSIKYGQFFDWLKTI